MMDNSPQQFCLWVTKHVSKFFGTNKMLHRWGVAIDTLFPFLMVLVFQEYIRNQLHFLDK